MLSFSQEKGQNEKKARSPIKFMPDLVNGISAEAPETFQHPHSLVSKNSYVNPYLNFEVSRIKKLENGKEQYVKPEWTKKVNLQLVEVLIIEILGAKDCQ